jgi:RNA polymerase sigma-32 factor
MVRAAKRAPILGVEEEADLARRAQGGDAGAFKRLLESHLRLVLTIAHEFRSYGLPLEDLVSEGALGLVEAARRFDTGRSVRLAAYAAWWIRAYMRRYTIANRRIVRTPSSRHGRKLLANMRRTQRNLAQANGGQPDAGAVAAALGVTTHDVEEMEAALSGRDLPCGLDSHGRGFEAVAEAPTPEAVVADAQERRHCARVVGAAMQTLTARERDILRQRYFADEAGSLAAVGTSLGLSRERVRQLQYQAQGKMRDAMMTAVA